MTAATPSFTGNGPTTEQQRQRPFDVESIVDHGQVKTRAYRRQPLYKTLAKISGPLTDEEMASLDIYRETHDRADRSLVKSCLDLDGDGRMRKPDSIVHVNHAVREARDIIASLEASIGPLVDTLRAVALEDRTFSDVAMERFGSRKADWIEVNEPVLMNGRKVFDDHGKQKFQIREYEKLVPRSNRDREVVSGEYKQAVTMLAAAIRSYRTSGGAEELWVAPIANGRFRIWRGAMAPKGPFRMRGSRHAVAATVEDLARGLNSELDYPDYGTAKAALSSAAKDRLEDIDVLSIYT